MCFALGQSDSTLLCHVEQQDSIVLAPFGSVLGLA